MWRLARRCTAGAAAGWPGSVETTHDCPHDGCESVSWPRRALWLLLPACASLMLLATTNHVCQDVAVVPFLWVVPLALYLLSFIICFDHPRWYVRGVWSVLAVAAIVLAADPDTIVGKIAPVLHQWDGRIPKDFSLNYIHELVLYFSAMFLICMVCHGELMRLRPHPRRLTEYYLLMSAGGALGGVFVSLVAPLIFKTFFEWPLGLALSFVVAGVAMTLAAVPPPGRREARPFQALPVAAAAGAALGLLLAMLWPVSQGQEGWVMLDRARNFYGVISCSRLAPRSARRPTHPPPRQDHSRRTVRGPGKAANPQDLLLL